MSVETKDASRSCVPGTAAAHVEWPSPAGKLTMLITNPYSAVVAGEKNEAYIEPQVRSAVADSAHPSIGAGSGNGDGVVKDGLTVTPFFEDKENHFRTSPVNAQLKGENEQAGYQSYAGGWVASSSGSRELWARTTIMRTRFGSCGSSEPTPVNACAWAT